MWEQEFYPQLIFFSSSFSSRQKKLIQTVITALLLRVCNKQWISGASLEIWTNRDFKGRDFHMENIKPSLYFPYREEAVRLEKDSTAAYLLQCKAHMLFTTTAKSLFFVSHKPCKQTFVGTQQPRCFPAMCRVGTSLSPGVEVTYQPPHGLLHALHCSARWAALCSPAAAALGAAAAAPPPPSPSWPWPGSHSCCWNAVSPSEWCYLKQQEKLLKSPLN